MTTPKIVCLEDERKRRNAVIAVKELRRLAHSKPETVGGFVASILANYMEDKLKP